MKHIKYSFKDSIFDFTFRITFKQTANYPGLLDLRRKLIGTTARQPAYEVYQACRELAATGKL